MNIQTEFNLGDILFYVYPHRMTEKINCPGCDGTGEIILKDGSSYECPKCDGVAYRETFRETIWTVSLDAFQVNLIVVKIDKQQDVMYQGAYGAFHKEKDCFKSFEVAQKECDLRNKGK